jgi:serine/threonine-protein kinase
MASDPAAPTARSKTMPMLCQGLDTFGGPGFVRERLALMGKTVFLLSFSFWILLSVSLIFIGGAPWKVVVLGPIGLSHLAASVTMGLLWLLASRPSCSLAMLGLLDAGSVILGCGLLSGMMIWDQRQILQTLLAIMVTVMIRAILVPSTPKRTTLISSLAFLATLVATVAVHQPVDPASGFSPTFLKGFLVLNTAAWCVLGVTLATVTSQVTYGLRQQVAEATDIGQYVLEEKIGGGGMGEIWRARHRLLIRPAAVKLIRRQALGSMPGDPELLMRRFEREARATAALKSPHTVQLYDFGVTDDGTLYYVMELLDGLDLDTLVKRHGPVPAERVIHIMRQVCSSLADAHGSGLVHRDIKPANIIVSRMGATFDFVKVLDFGLVKLDGARRDNDAVKLTAVGSTSGTPGFMAPEVALAAADSDHRVDLYSLGCVGYWLLTGKLVFEGDSALKVMIDHARTAPRRPSGRVEVPIPTPLEDLIMECLEKDPDRRPATADVLAARLTALPAANAWTSDRAERWWAAHMPTPADTRPLADILLSQEGRPIRLGRPARPRG